MKLDAEARFVQGPRYTSLGALETGDAWFQPDPLKSVMKSNLVVEVDLQPK